MMQPTTKPKVPPPPHIIEEIPRGFRKALGWDLPTAKRRRRHFGDVFVQLENVFWLRLERMAHAEGQTIGEFVRQFADQPRGKKRLPAELRRLAMENAEAEVEELWKIIRTRGEQDAGQ